MKTITEVTVTAKPTATITTTALANVTDGKTVTVGNKVYTFKSALTPTEGEVLIATGGTTAQNADNSLLNLIRAINHTGTPDTDYKCAAAHTQVTAASSVTSHAFAVTSILSGVGDTAYAVDTDDTSLSWDGDYLTLKSMTVAATVEDYTFTTPAQQVSVGEFPEANANWSRSVRVSDQGVFVYRYGTGRYPAAILTSVVAQLARYISPSLSWEPRFSTQPSDATTVSGGASFSVVADTDDEIAPYAYAWYRRTTDTGSWVAITGVNTPNESAGAMDYSGYDTATLSITGAASGQSGYQYKCRATSVVGYTDSEVATLTFGT